MDWRSNLYSVFISNLSTRVSNKIPWETFSAYGRVLDVFVQRRTTNWLTYAFVRYREKFELLNAIKMADRRSIDGEIIKVVEADSRQAWRKKGEEPAPNNNHRNVFNSQREINHVDIPSLQVDTNGTAETEQWLERSAVGRLRSLIHPTILRETLLLEGLDADVSKFGGLKVVITFKSKEAMSFSLCKHVRVFEAWFVYIKPWDCNSLCDERLMWFSIEGVPLHLWNSDFFTKVGNYWGNFIATDDSTARKVRLDVARLLIAVGRNHRPSLFLRVHAARSVFVLKIHTTPAMDIVSFPSDHQVTPKAGQTKVIPVDTSKPEEATIQPSRKETSDSGISKNGKNLFGRMTFQSCLWEVVKAAVKIGALCHLQNMLAAGNQWSA